MLERGIAMAIISNSIQNNSQGTSSGISSSRSQAYRSGSSTLHLQEGQTLKGVVSDVHGSEITLSMEDGSSFTGKLPDASQYSIGQKAAFQITSLDQNTIYMKAVSGAYLLDIEDTIEQALEEAALPKSDRNIEVVRSLLQNQQSISRENIIASIQLCARFPKVDVNAIITMKRLNLPMTQESVKQFENYQNQNHQLLNKMDSLTNDIGNMLNSIGSQVPRLAAEIGSRILAMVLEGNPTPEEQALLEKTASADNVLLENPEGEDAVPADPKQTAETGTAKAGSPEGADGNAARPAETEIISPGDPAKAEQAQGPFARMKQLFTTLTDGNAAARTALTESGLSEDFRTPFIHEQTGFILSPEERQSFSAFLSDYPLSDEGKQALADGTATARQLLSEIKNMLPELTEEQAGKLLTSRSFQNLVKAQFISGWTVSPEQLKKEQALDIIYDKMSRQFESLSHFSEQVLGKDVFSQLTQHASDMSNNLDFMKMMNQTFQYIQLPLKLQNQTAHGDLYVMTRKEALRRNPGKLSVLLHLDMDHLGTLDIQILKENTAVSANFFVSTKETKDLLERNIELLNDAINEQGYAFTSQLSMKEKDMDVVKDFIGADAPVGDLKRYNFDLRA